MSRIIKGMYLTLFLMLVLIVAVTNIQYVNSKKALSVEAEKNASLDMKLSTTLIGNWIDARSEIITNALRYSMRNLENPEAIRKFYQEQTDQHPEYLSIFIGLPDGNYIDNIGVYNDAGIHYQDWYQQAVDSNQLTIINKYDSASNGKQILTLSKSFYNRDEELLGVIGANVELKDLNEILGYRKHAKGEWFFILDSNNQVVNSNIRDFDQTVTNDTLEKEMEALSHLNKWKQSLEQDKTTLSDELLTATVDGREGYFYYSEVENVHWKVLCFIPKDVYFASQSSMRILNIALIVFVTVLFGYMFFNQRRQITKPLMELERQIAKIDVEKDFGYYLYIRSSSVLMPLTQKINELLKSTYSMIRQISDDKEEFQALNEELEASVGQLVAMEQEASRQKINFEALFKNSSNAIVMFDHELNVLDVNDRFESFYGYPLSQIIGKNLDEMVLSKESLNQGTHELTKMILKGQIGYEEGIRYGADGRTLEVSVQSVPILIGDYVAGGYAVYSDISERKARERNMQYISTHDDLTDLYNRSFYDLSLKKFNHESYMPCGCIMLDLNGLKIINDAFGHVVGDMILVEVSNRIKELMDPSYIACRIGGDEFAILVPNSESSKMEQLANDLRKACSDIKIGEVTISVSIGWAERHSTHEPVWMLLKTAEDYMNRNKLTEVPSIRGKAVYAIINTLHEKNKREEQHSIRVGDLSYKLGKALGASTRELNELKTMGLLHDIGKIAIDENILNKPAALTADEYEEIKKHPDIGFRILKSVSEMTEIAEYVLAHHESWDGSGYPRGLKGEAIPYLSRIIAVADTYDAMTSDRAYRKALPREVAIAEIKKFAGIQFDPKIVETFITHIDQFE